MTSHVWRHQVKISETKSININFKQFWTIFTFISVNDAEWYPNFWILFPWFANMGFWPTKYCKTSLIQSYGQYAGMTLYRILNVEHIRNYIIKTLFILFHDKPIQTYIQTYLDIWGPVFTFESATSNSLGSGDWIFNTLCSIYIWNHFSNCNYVQFKTNRVLEQH